MNFMSQLLKNFKKESCIHHLETISGVLIWLTCSYSVNLIRDLEFYYVIDIFSKYTWLVPLKDKKGISIVHAFQIILKESNRKPNKTWVDKGSEFYNNSFKKWLQDTDIVMYSTNNEGKSVIAERFIRTLKNKFINT